MERDMHYLDEHSEGHNKCSSGSHLPQRIILGRCDNGKEKLERYYKKVAENKDIIPENKKLILEFYELCRAKGLSNARLCKTIWIMKNIGIWMGKKSFAEATKADIVQLVNLIQDRYSEPATATDYKTMLKKFYKCTFGKEKTMPEAVEWVKVKNGRDEGKIDPSQIFTEDDILRILQAEDIPNNTWAKIRNKALVSFIYDSGVRIGELLSMRTGDIKISNELWYVTVIGKTGQRTFPIFPCIPYLKDYLSIHPRKGDESAVLWCSFNNPDNHICYIKASQILKRAVKRAGIKKPSNPHNFRHSAVSRDASFMSDQELKKKYGWTRNSEQLATYSHIRLEDLENSCRKHYMLEEAQIETVMLLKPCPSCNAKNKPHEKFCANCKKPLDIKEILAAEGKRNAVDELVFEFLSILAEENPRIKGRFVELVKRKNVEGLFK